MRYAWRVTDGRRTDVRFVAPDYQLQDGEQEGDAEFLPSPDLLPPPSQRPTIDDVIAILTPEQQAALQARVNAATNE